MVSSNVDALGIIFPNSYDATVPELVTERLMASIPFASRYRMIDFVLSGMVNAGIDNISVIVRKNYHSLMDHLGSGRAWDLSRKNGGLNIVPPFAEKAVKVYHGRVEALASILTFLRDQKEKYVIMADTNVAANYDFKEVISQHIATNADVTVIYTKWEASAEALSTNVEQGDMYYTLNLQDGRVTDIHINPKEEGIQNLSMNIYVVNRELLIHQIEDAYIKGYPFYERDVLIPQVKDLNVQGYEYTGYLALITSLKSYCHENMRLLDEKNADALFSGNHIYTKVRDDNPSRYTSDAKVKNVMAADGCIIEGEVENCVLFRGVKIKKGAVVKNSILMQDTVVESDAHVEYVITDKNVTITSGKDVKGAKSYPFYVAKHKIV